MIEERKLALQPNKLMLVIKIHFEIHLIVK